MERYSVIKQKNPREIVLLRGSGCKWKRCTFCDYHFDYSTDEEENYLLNKNALDKVQGIYGKLEVINSGSFCDLDERTMESIFDVCKNKAINTLHFECHYVHKNAVADLKRKFRNIGVDVRIKTGVETFDVDYREKILVKGFGKSTPEDIRKYADEVCLLFGLKNQTVQSMKYDIETGLKYFDRVCVNIMTPNSTEIKPDYDVIKAFSSEIAPLYIDNERVDILMENTDFGVGSEDNKEV